jgi:hypothetical protein
MAVFARCAVDSKALPRYHLDVFKKLSIAEKFNSSEHIVVYPGDCLELLKSIPDKSMQLVVTSPSSSRSNT